MKTDALDFLLAIAVIALVATLSLSLTGSAAAPLTVGWWVPYHILTDALFFLLSYGIISGVVMRLILVVKPFVPGNYSMDDSQFRVWILYSIIYSLASGALKPFTTVFTKPLIPKLFGAKLGQRVALGGDIGDAPMVTVGERSIIGRGASVIGHAITSGRIILGRVRIGSDVTVGVNAVIWPGVEIGDGAIVVAGSVVSMNTCIPANELWGGSPARKIKNVTAGAHRG